MDVAPQPLTSPKRILYVIALSWWGGAQKYVYDLATYTHAQGHTVEVVTGAGELADRLEAEGIAVTRVAAFQRDISLSAEIDAYKAISERIKTFKPDIVHGNSSKSGFLAVLAARLHGVRRIIFTAHAWAFTEKRGPVFKAVFWLAHYITVLLSDVTICVSEAVRRGARHMPFVRRKLTVIYNGVAQVSFLSQEEARNALIPHASEAVWIGTISELHSNKNLETMLRGFARIAKTHPNSLLAIIGGGDEHTALAELADTLDITARVHFCGHRPDAARYLHAFSIFALSSRTEALGYVLLEAGLAALPTVATDVGGIPEIVKHEETGLLFPVEDDEALARALDRYLSDTALRGAMASSLNAHVEHSFSKAQMLTQTLALYVPPKYS